MLSFPPRPQITSRFLVPTSRLRFAVPTIVHLAPFLLELVTAPVVGLTNTAPGSVNGTELLVTVPRGVSITAWML
jgi:hypothetical protein